MYTPKIYETITIDGAEYKLRITARSLVEEEKRTGKNPLSVLTSMTPGNIPEIQDILTLFYAALKPLNANITYDNVFDLYEKFLDDGHTYVEFIEVIMDSLKASGFIADDKETAGESDEKN